MRMADRDAQRVGRILARQPRQLQQAHHHLLHLLLAGLPVADDRTSVRPNGVCLYRSAESGRMYLFAIDLSSVVEQAEVTAEVLWENAEYVLERIVPVAALPRTSRPARRSGIACAWIGVGSS